MKICRRLAACVLTMAMLAGCAPGSSASASPLVMGGYRETEISPANSDDWTWKTLCADENGNLHLLGTPSDAAPQTLPNAVRYMVYENGEWHDQPAGWGSGLAELCPAPVSDGSYSITFGAEQDTVWTAVSFTAKGNEFGGEEFNPDGNRLWLFHTQDGALVGGEVELDGLPQGNLFFSGDIQCGETLLLPTGSSVIEIDRGGTVRHSFAGQNGALQSDGVLVMDQTGYGFRRFLQDGTSEELHWEGIFTSLMTMTSRDGAAYLAGKAGFFRAKNGTLEQLAEGSRMRLNRPDFFVSSLAVVRDDTFYVLEGLGRVYRYDYDPEFLVEKEKITVFSFLYNEAVNTAVSEMAVQYPEITVNYQYAADTDAWPHHKVFLSDGIETEFSYSDYENTVRSLYASIAAGNGPDVLILDDLDAAPFMEQGMLANLNDLVDTSVVYPALLEPYAKDGGQYALPTRFYPWIVGSWGDMPELNTFDDLKNAILAGRPRERSDGKQEENLDGVVMAMNGYEDLFPILYISWQQRLEEGDRDDIREFLQQGQELGEHMGLGFCGYSFSVRFNASLFSFGTTSMFCSPTGYQFSLTNTFSSWQDHPASAEGHIALLPDTQGDTLCQPSTVAAISAPSTHKETAARFIEILLSDSVQNNSLMENGVSAVPACIRKQFDRYQFPSEDGDLLLQDNPADLFEQVDRCIPDNPVREGRIAQTAMEYWGWGLTLEEAVEAIAAQQ